MDRMQMLICSRILLGATHQQDVRYGATFLITSGTYSSIGLMNAWCMLDLLYFYCSINFSTQQLVIISALKQREPLGFPSTVLLDKSEASWDPISIL
jgi:hypothetical protein